MRKLAFAPIACCLVVIGCTISWWGEFDQLFYFDEYQQVYSNFGDPWVGHQVEELIAERGQPDSVLEAKPKWSAFEDGVHVLSYIYYNDAAAGGSCIDTYVVVEDSGAIIKYYCR